MMMSQMEAVYAVYSASLRAETWRMSGRDIARAVGDDDKEAGGDKVHGRREAGALGAAALGAVASFGNSPPDSLSS